jgi:hypothetical protein
MRLMSIGDPTRCRTRLVRNDARLKRLEHQVNRGVIGSPEKRFFLALVVVQAFHSAEEFVFRLYDAFPPARFLSGLVAADRQVGFVVINVLLVFFGIWCYVWPVRREWPFAAALLWGWVIVEMSNGIVHPTWSMVRGSYTPGVVTSILCLAVALLLARQLWRQRRHQASTLYDVPGHN